MKSKFLKSSIVKRNKKDQKNDWVSQSADEKLNVDKSEDDKDVTVDEDEDEGEQQYGIQ